MAGASKEQNMSSSGQYYKTHYDRKNYDDSNDRISGVANYDASVINYDACVVNYDTKFSSYLRRRKFCNTGHRVSKHHSTQMLLNINDQM